MKERESRERREKKEREEREKGERGERERRERRERGERGERERREKRERGSGNKRVCGCHDFIIADHSLMTLVCVSVLFKPAVHHNEKLVSM
jgi:hypothetical protein